MFKKKIKLLTATEAFAASNTAIERVVNRELARIQHRINEATSEAETILKCVDIPKQVNTQIRDNLEHRGYKLTDHFKDHPCEYFNISWG
jgi:hypothetical protein